MFHTKYFYPFSNYQIQINLQRKTENILFHQASRLNPIIFPTTTSRYICRVFFTPQQIKAEMIYHAVPSVSPRLQPNMIISYTRNCQKLRTVSLERAAKAT